MEKLRAAAAAGDAVAFERGIVALVESDGFARLQDIRRAELLFSCHSPAKRAAVRRAYLDALLRLRAPPDLLRDAVVYASYCEVVAELRDDIAKAASVTGTGLDRLDILDAIEASTRVVASEIRRFVKRSVASSAAASTRRPLEMAARVADVSHEIGGLQSLLPHMIKQLNAGRSQVVAREHQDGPCAVTAARRLFRVAEHWQTLTYLRQRVAFGEIRVERVAQGQDGAHLFVVPNRIHEAWRHPSVERRLSAMRTSRQLSGAASSAFPVDLIALTGAVVGLVPGTTGNDVVARVVNGLSGEIGASIRAVDILLLGQAEEPVAALTLALWAAHLVVHAINLVGYEVLGCTGYSPRPPEERSGIRHAQDLNGPAVTVSAPLDPPANGFRPRWVDKDGLEWAGHYCDDG